MNILSFSQTEIVSEHTLDKGASLPSPLLFWMTVRMSFLEDCTLILHKNSSCLSIVFRPEIWAGEPITKPLSLSSPTCHTPCLPHAAVPPSCNHHTPPLWGQPPLLPCPVFTWLTPFPQQGSSPGWSCASLHCDPKCNGHCLSYWQSISKKEWFSFMFSPCL